MDDSFSKSCRKSNLDDVVYEADPIRDPNLAVKATVCREEDLIGGVGAAKEAENFNNLNLESISCRGR